MTSPGVAVLADLEELAGVTDASTTVRVGGRLYTRPLDPVDGRSDPAVRTRGRQSALLDPVDSAAVVAAAYRAVLTAVLDPADSRARVTLTAIPDLAAVFDGYPIPMTVLARAALLILPGGAVAAVAATDVNTDYDAVVADHLPVVDDTPYVDGGQQG